MLVDGTEPFISTALPIPYVRRRRLLVTVVALGSGCTSTEYRRSGPRSVPTAPSTDVPSTSDPSVDRTQAVVQPLNEVYRLVRTTLNSFEVADVSNETLSTARSQLERARESVSDVDDPTGAYRSLPTLVTAHGLLVDSLAIAVDLYTELYALVAGDARETPLDDVSTRTEPLRSLSATLATRAADLANVVSSEPTVPPSLFATLDGLDGFATGLDRQATAVGRLLDVVERELAARVDWQAGVDAFDQGAFVVSETSFVDARDHYRDAATLLDGDLRTEGSFADLTEQLSCVVGDGLDAVSLALRAVDAARAGEIDSGRERLETAESRRNRCVDAPTSLISPTRRLTQELYLKKKTAGLRGD